MESGHRQSQPDPPLVSVLFDDPEQRAAADSAGVPEYFADLNLDQVIEAVTAGREQYDLAPLFCARLDDVASIAYRQEVFRDLDGKRLIDDVRDFARRMQAMRERIARAADLRHPYQKKRWFLDAVDSYCEGVRVLSDNLARAELGSRGLHRVRDYLGQYASAASFSSLVADTERAKRLLAEITYCIRIRGDRVQVSRYDQEEDYSADVAQTFAKFQQGVVEEYRARFSDRLDMNHVEERILDLVAQLYPEAFATLDGFCDAHRDFLDATVAAFDREIQFYVAYLEHAQRLERAGLRFCYPRVHDRSKEVSASATFDIALADRLVQERTPVIVNDFTLRGPERIFVVTGPNQGGKTTFARTFGQLHHLANIGCPVPGTAAELALFDQLFTHFEREEDLQGLRGKLEDDLLRVHAILEAATPDSVVILNEIFTSTTLQDALVLGTRVLGALTELELLGVCVTFVDELASLSPATVSMVSTVAPDNPAERTYKVVRRAADGIAYAAALAEKYGLTYERLSERMAS
jgi:DNA mismatch repair protein MutS